MPTIRKRKGPTGNVAFLAQVRVRGFKPAAKTFRVDTTHAEARARAVAWGQALERELKAQSSRAGARRDITQLTIGGLVAEYLADAETRALRTYSEVERLLESFWLNKYATERVLDFGVIQLRQARDKLQTPGRSAGTVNRYLGAMRGAWNWARATGLIPSERAWPMRLMLTEPRGRQRFLSDSEVAAVLKAAEADPVMRAAIIVSLSSGMRQGELLRLTWADIDLAGGKCLIRETKNGEMRSVHLTPAAVEALKGLRKLPVVSPVHPFVTASGTPLKQSFLEVRWRRISDAAKLDDFRWHDLRHSCASILLQSGATLGMVGAVLGHRSPAMTMRYAHLVAGQAVTGHDALDAKLRGTP
ncbi:MAG: tyrosine-type recombinase/integrase [Steroidobacteraceae bacterium]